MFGILLATLIDFVLYTFVFMIYPIIIRIKEKKQLSEDYLKKFKTNSIVGAFILAIIIKLVSTPEISAYSIGAFMGYLGRMFVYSIMYFYINKWLFIKNSNKGKNSVISIISLIILIIMFILGIIGFNDNSDDKYYDEDENRLKASHILVDDYSTAKDIINKLNNGGNFCDLVSEYSTDTATSEDCGNIGFFEEGEMVDEFYDAVINLEIGEYTKTPIRTDYGYHIIYRED